ncbi:MAG: Ig-like domain-containing protein [Comamonadaceae bacterium]|jgi:protocatechuate 3,4-dioxygenase beta subunit|nr:Ig-like domain-containing protein [Comamonadaceae bacterium]
MAKKMAKALSLVALAAALAACGGGGGNPGTTGPSTGGTSGGTTGGTGGTGGTGTTPIVTQGAVSVRVYNQPKGVEAQTDTFSASDLTVKARATVLDANGAPLPKAIVTFSETGPGLLGFIPDSATAMTNGSGVAEIDLRGLKEGATQLVATVTQPDSAGVAGDVAGKIPLSISAATAVDPQTLVSAINFSSASPADKSIVIAGAGGNGRSEVALLTFTVVDAGGSPVAGAQVDFDVVPAGSVTLRTASAKSNASGQVVATVNSKADPVTVTVNATVHGKSISTASDTLTVTTGTATQLGFDLSASKFNMDTDLSGDASTLTVRVADKSGNPVADGLAIVAQTNYGAVGSSARGGCTTRNGSCTVDFTVQNPRPVDGVPATVVFSTQTGQGTLISDTLQLSMTSAGWLNLYDAGTNTPRTAPINLVLVDAASCKFGGVGFLLGTPAGYPAPAGTTVSARSRNGLATPTVVAGSPTLDRGFSRTAVEFSASGKTGNPAGTDTWVFQFTAGPSKATRVISLDVNVPGC